MLAIDDVQWAEPLLLDLTEHLVEWSTDMPLLVLLAARPELRETRPALTRAGGLVREVMTLAGLDAGAATRLAANVVGADELPAAIAGRVLATSEGNPLFVGELVRMLVHDGALKREGDRWTDRRGAGRAGDAADDPRRCSPRASSGCAPRSAPCSSARAVIGRSFSRAALTALLPRESSAALEERARRRCGAASSSSPITGWYPGRAGACASTTC